MQCYNNIVIGVCDIFVYKRNPYKSCNQMQNVPKSTSMSAAVGSLLQTLLERIHLDPFIGNLVSRGLLFYRKLNLKLKKRRAFKDTSELYGMGCHLSYGITVLPDIHVSEHTPP